MSSSPASRIRAVAASDSANLPGGPCRALYVGTGGDIALRAADSDTDVTFKNVPQGMVLPVCAARVLATGTTASNLVALY